MVFFVFLWFFPKLSLSILFFNIELVKNYNYNMWGKHCSFPHKLLRIATIFFPHGFFNFFLIIFVNFIFLILCWLRITITSKAKSCREDIVALLTKNYGCHNISSHVFFSFFCVFFLLWFCFKLSLSIFFFNIELVII